eukprot:6387219-Prymnesium_polylepis.1
MSYNGRAPPRPSDPRPPTSTPPRTPRHLPPDAIRDVDDFEVATIPFTAFETHIDLPGSAAPKEEERLLETSLPSIPKLPLPVLEAAD